MPTREHRIGPPVFSRLDGASTGLLSDLAAEQISAMIRSGQLPVGSRLPAERDLAQRLGVSRTALREALRVLEAGGSLEARVGRGRFVSSGDGTQRVLAAGGWLRVHEDEVAERNHLLVLLEPPALLEVPAHLVPQVAADARAIIELAAAAVEADDPVAGAKLDKDFHRALCNRTPNRLLRDLITGLYSASIESAMAVYSIPSAAQRSLDQHSMIVDALERGSREEASQLLREHGSSAHRYAAEQAHPGSGA